MKKFNFPISFQVFLLFGIIFFVSILIFSQGNSSSNIFTNIIFLIFALLCLLYFFRFLSVISIDKSKIVRKYPFGFTNEILLSRIFSIRENDLLQLLEIKDVNDKVILRIDKNLKGYIEFKNIISIYLENNNRVKRQDYFNRSISIFILVTFLAIFFLALAIYSIIEDDYLGVLFLIGVFLFPYSLYTEAKSLEIVKSGIQINYYLRKKFFKFNQIDEIQQRIEQVKFNRVTNVYLILGNGKEIKLGGFNPDDETLYNSLIYHYEKSSVAT